MGVTKEQVESSLVSKMNPSHIESAMAGEQQGDQQAVGPSAAGWRATVEEQYRKITENVETYPYVWASYIVVYGGFGLWMAYRWRKLRRTEDRVRVLQERLRELIRAEEESAAASASSSSAAAEKATRVPPAAMSAEKALPVADKAPR